MEFVKAGKLKIMAFQDKVVKGFEHTPTIREFHNIEIIPNLQAVWGPKGIPGPIVKKLEQAFASAVKDPALIKVYESFYMPINFMDTNEVHKSVETSFRLAERVIRSLQSAEKDERK